MVLARTGQQSPAAISQERTIETWVWSMANPVARYGAVALRPPSHWRVCARAVRVAASAAVIGCVPEAFLD